MKGGFVLSKKDVKKTADKLLQEYCESYKNSLYKYAYLRTGHDKSVAEDCVQDAFMVIYKRLCKGEKFLQPKAFLYRTVDNFVKESIRDKQKQVKIQDAIAVPENTSLEMSIFDQLDEQTENEIIKAIFKTMSDKDKVIYRRRYIDKCNVRDIAQEYNISVSTVTTRLYRIRQKVEEQVKLELKERGIFND